MLKEQLLLTRLAVGRSPLDFNIELGGRGRRKSQREEKLPARIGCERRKPQHNFGKTGKKTSCEIVVCQLFHLRYLRYLSTLRLMGLPSEVPRPAIRPRRVQEQSAELAQRGEAEWKESASVPSFRPTHTGQDCYARLSFCLWALGGRSTAAQRPLNGRSTAAQ